MHIWRRKNILKISKQEFLSLIQPYTSVLLDLGTGDGRFVYDTARANPETLCVGIDPVAENFSAYATKAERESSKDIATNALYVRASLESIPEELFGCADAININYPWGSLLRAAVLPDKVLLEKISKLAKNNSSTFHILLNYSALAQNDLLSLPEISPEYVEKTLLPAYQTAQINITEWRIFKGEPGIKTSWGQRLSKGSKRASLELKGVRR